VANARLLVFERRSSSAFLGRFEEDDYNSVWVSTQYFFETADFGAGKVGGGVKMLEVMNN
jgi:hypothetical protein